MLDLSPSERYLADEAVEEHARQLIRRGQPELPTAVREALSLDRVGRDEVAQHFGAVPGRRAESPVTLC